MNTKFGTTIESIRAKPHWQFRFRPAEHSTVFPSPPACRAFVERNAISLRGWPFPFLESRPDGHEIGLNYFGSSCNWSNHIEYWRLYQSAQYYHLLSLRENEPALQERLRTQFREETRTAIAVSYVGVVLTLTEALLFAKNLAAVPGFGPILHAEISLKQVAGCPLGFGDRYAEPGAPYRTDLGEIPWTSEIAVSDLLQKPEAPALEAATYIFHRFGWDEPNIPAIQKLQSQLITRTL